MIGKRRLWIRWAPVGIVTALIGAFVLWASTPLGPMPEALAALQSDATVEVVSGRVMIFRPKGINPDTGLIFYPGGRVDARSYAPAAREIAAHGYLVVLPRMPFNLAVFAPDRASTIIDQFPAVEHWAVGGHSLGGAMAARYALEHAGRVEGLVLWASYPPSGDDLSDLPLQVVSIFGSRDNAALSGRIQQSRLLLPDDTIWVPVEGGNHAQFGWYGPQPGDNAAEISRAVQQSQAVEVTVALLAGLGEEGQ